MPPWPHVRPPGPGVTFARPPRKRWNWPAVWLVVAIVACGLALLGAALILPELARR